MRILVVDDELITRQWFETTLHALDPNYKVDTAANGKAALELCNNGQYDLIITDIKMPVMDGITLIKKIKELHSDIPIIVLSAFGDFEYARNTLQMGAHSYVLKAEVTEEALVELLNKIGKKSTQINQSKTDNECEQIETKLGMLLNGTLEDDKVEILHEQLFKGYKRFRSMRILLLEPSGMHILNNTFNEKLNTITSRYCERTYCIAEGNSYYMLLLAADKRGIHYLENNIATIYSDLADMSHELGRFKLVAGVSKLGDRVNNNLNKMDLQAQNALEYQRFYFNTGICQFDQIVNNEILCNKLNRQWDLVSREIVQELEYFNYYSAKQKLINFVFDIADKCIMKPMTLKNILKDAVLLFLNETYRHKYPGRTISDQYDEFEKQIDNIKYKESFKDEINKIFKQIIKIYENNINKYSEPIYKVYKFIQNNYAKDISLDKIADYIHLNKSYLSERFRIETGITISKFIISIRMDKAKKLLLSKQYSIGQVSDMVGFSNQAYFTRQFKNYYGITPKGFLTKNQKKL